MADEERERGDARFLIDSRTCRRGPRPNAVYASAEKRPVVCTDGSIRINWVTARGFAVGQRPHGYIRGFRRLCLRPTRLPRQRRPRFCRACLSPTPDGILRGFSLLWRGWTVDEKRQGYDPGLIGRLRGGKVEAKGWRRRCSCHGDRRRLLEKKWID